MKWSNQSPSDDQEFASPKTLHRVHEDPPLRGATPPGPRPAGAPQTSPLRRSGCFSWMLVPKVWPWETKTGLPDFGSPAGSFHFFSWITWTLAKGMTGSHQEKDSKIHLRGVPQTQTHSNRLPSNVRFRYDLQTSPHPKVSSIRSEQENNILNLYPKETSSFEGDPGIVLNGWSRSQKTKHNPNDYKMAYSVLG